MALNFKYRDKSHRYSMPENSHSQQKTLAGSKFTVSFYSNEVSS